VDQPAFGRTITIPNPFFIGGSARSNPFLTDQ